MAVVGMNTLLGLSLGARILSKCTRCNRPWPPLPSDSQRAMDRLSALKSCSILIGSPCLPQLTHLLTSRRPKTEQRP